MKKMAAKGNANTRICQKKATKPLDMSEIIILEGDVSNRRDRLLMTTVDPFSNL